MLIGMEQYQIYVFHSDTFIKHNLCKRKMITMEKGKIIFLNGVTSSGKTSIVEAMQDYSEPFFYVVGNDLFENTIGDKHLQTGLLEVS